MVIFRPSIPLSPQQQGRLQLLEYPPEVVDGTKFDVYSGSPAPCGTPRCVCSCIDLLYCPSCPSYGYNEGLSRLSLTSLIDQPALELEASLAAGLRFSPRETGLPLVPSLNSLPYPKPIDLKAEQQTQRSQSSGTSASMNGTQGQETTTSRRGLLDDNTQTPDTNGKTSSRPSDGVSTKIHRPSLQGNTWLLANRTKDSKIGGLDALANLSASEQASLARFTPPDTPSPEKNKAVLHKPPAFGSPNDSARHHDNAAQHAQLPSQHDHSPCSAFDQPLNGKHFREEDSKKQRCEDAEMPPISPLTPDNVRRIGCNNFNKAQEGISSETPTKLDKGKGQSIDPPWANNTEIRPSSPVSEQDIHLDAAETLTSLAQARKFDKGKGKAVDPRSSQLVGKRPYDALQPQFNDFSGAQESTDPERTRKLDKGKGKAIDPLWSNKVRPPPSPTPEQALPWNDPILSHRRDNSIPQEPPRSPRPRFRSLPAEKPLPPVFSEGTSVAGREAYASIEGRGYDTGRPSNLLPAPRPTPFLRFKPLPARDASSIPQEKSDALEAFDRDKPAFDLPACFFSDSDTYSEEGIEIPYARREVADRSKFLADTIRDHFQLPKMAPPKRAYDFPEPERTRRLLRFDREVATPYITEHRSVQTSTYEEEENEASYLQNACCGMINLNKSGDLFDEHRFRWRNGFDRLEKLGKAMTVWSHRGYGAPRSYMEHDKLAHAEMKKRRYYRERMVRAGKVSRGARRAGLCVDREGFVVPPRKKAPRVPPGVGLSPSAGDAWERHFVRQRDMMRWAEKVVTGGSGARPDDIHDPILPSTEGRISGEWHTPNSDDECDSDIDENPELDDLRLARGLPPRRYPARRLPPFDPMANLRLRNPASADAQSSAMVFPGFDLNEPMINACPPSASTSPDDPNPKPNAIFRPSWVPRHFSSFVGKINHSKKGAGAQMPKVVLTSALEPADDEWKSEDDKGWAEEEYLQSQGTAGASFPGWDEVMINGRLRPVQPLDPRPVGTFCPSWDSRHYDHFVKERMEEGARVPRVVVTMPCPEPGEKGWDSEDEWED